MTKVLEVGRENNEFQHLEVLKRNRTKRKQYGEVFIEGVAPINALLKSGWKVTTIAYNREKELSNWAKDVISRTNPDKVLRLSADLMDKLSERVDPSELIVISERRVYRLEQLTLSHSATILVFDRPSNHGNLGSLIRSGDALGVTGLITTGHSVDIYDPTVIRASLGAFFTVPTVHCPSPNKLEAWLESVRDEVPEMKVVGTMAESPRPLYEVDMTGPVTIILGNEAEGMSRNLVALTDENVVIPMHGMVDSLNVACAGTVLLYEILRQRDF